MSLKLGPPRSRLTSRLNPILKDHRKDEGEMRHDH
jgi:hypothetical protein